MVEPVKNLVSTIIPAYNRAAYLKEAVQSVLAQSYRPIEIIISDDGSDQDAISVMHKLQAEHEEVTQVLLNENRGAGPAREAGRIVARGEFIQYLDSDDRLLPEKFSIQVQALKDQPECGVAYGHIRLFSDEGTVKEKPHKWSGRKIEKLFPHLLVDRWWNTDAPLWRREICDRIGPWSDLRYSQDWEYDARAGALGVRLAYCPVFVCEQRHHSGSRQTGHGNWLEPSDQLRFFTSLYECALKAGVKKESAEMRHFSRWVFSMARNAGAARDGKYGDQLLELARDATHNKSIEMGIYAFSVRILGWKNTFKIFETSRKILGRKNGASSLRQSWMSTLEDH